MKRVCIFSIVSAALFFLSACEKCFTCHNQCAVCYEHHSLGSSDTTLTIMVCSEKLSQKYYEEYIDSLTSPSLGWVCYDTASNYSEHFCTASMNLNKNFDLINKREEGLICTEE